MTEVGLFGGSFNPVHKGHTRLATELVEKGLFDEIWFVLSPQNPLKTNHSLATDPDRAAMLTLALDGLPHLKPCMAELELPRPSFTINTLRHLSGKFPNCRFQLIIGADNWLIFDRWKDHDKIISDYGVTIYPRPGYEIHKPLPAGVSYVEGVSVNDISSTQLRNNSSEVNNWLDPKVIDYIKAHKLYDRTK